MKKLILMATMLLIFGAVKAQVSEVKEDGIGFNYRLNQTEHSCAFCKKKYTTSEIDLISNISFDKNLGSLKQIRDAVAYTMTLYLWNITAGWTAMVEEECPSLDNKTPKHQWRNEQVSLSAKYTTSIKKGDDYRNSIENLYKGSYGFINKGMVDIILNRVLDKIDQNEPFKNLVYEEQKQKQIAADNIILKGEIKIGNQTWAVKNLNVEKFNNGDPITEAKTDLEWKNAGENKVPAWCYYKNDPSNGEKYGKLYNWYAINDSRGIAPIGWHIPSFDEWIQLGNTAGRRLKSKKYWHEYLNVDESSNFSAHPAGARGIDGVFCCQTYHGYWWSSNDEKEGKGLCFHLLYNTYDPDNENNVFQYASGLSVRCLKGEESEKVKQARQKKLEEEREKVEAIRIAKENIVILRKKSLSESETLLINNWSLQGKMTGKEDIIELEIIANFENDLRKTSWVITSTYWSVLKSNVYGVNIVTKDKKIATQINNISGVFEIKDNTLIVYVDSNEIKNTNFQDAKYSAQLTNLLNTTLKNMKIEKLKEKKIEVSNSEFDLKLKGERNN